MVENIIFSKGGHMIKTTNIDKFSTILQILYN